MRKRVIISLLSLLFLIACIALPYVPLSGERATRNNTLYIAGWQWGAPTNFNPFAPSPAWPVRNSEYLYETLFGYNLVTGKLDPILGEKYVWKDKLTLVVTLHKGTKWQDGKPLTANDVKWTFDLGKKYSLYYSSVWDYITSVKVVNQQTVEIKLNSTKPYQKVVESYLGSIYIAPQHIWTNLEKKNAITTAVNLKPVGSGPYKLLTYNQNQIVLERDDNYWGIKYFGKPAPVRLVHPIFKSNDAGNLAFEKGQIDLSQQFCPQIWKMWENKKLKVGTWYKNEPYYIPATIPSLWINIHKKPLDNPLVRKALAYSINYAKIAETAMSRYSPPAQSSLLIPLGVPEKKYFNKADVEKYGWKYDPNKAIEILEKELKAKKGSDGIYVLPDGTRLGPITVECPYGWTDWMTALEVVAESARKVGIDVRTNYPEAPVFDEHRFTGNFDLLMYTPAPSYGPSYPWQRFRDVMEYRGVPEMGQTAYWNYNRYKNPEAAKLLDQAATTTDEKQLTNIYKELNLIFMKDIPIIPLMYRPWDFYEYNEKYWAGFPNEKNPVAPPHFNGAGVKVLYKLKQVGK